MKKLLIIPVVISSLYSFDDEETSIYRDQVSNVYSHFLDNITSFMYDKNQNNFEYIKKHNTLRVYLNNTFSNHKKPSTSLSLRANIKLPKISKNLYISVDKEQNEKYLQDNELSELQKDKHNSRVGLKYYFLKQTNEEVFAKLGARLRLKNSKFYFKVGANKLKKFNNIYTFVYLNEYYYFKDDNFKTETGVNFTKKLSPNFTFIQNNGITLEESNSYINNTFLLDQYFNSKEMYSYWTTIHTQYNNNAFKTTSISLNLKYHRMLKKWIFIDVIPSIVKELQDEKNINKYMQINFGFIF